MLKKKSQQSQIKINDDIQVWGCSDFKNDSRNITYNKCGDERQLLEAVCDVLATELSSCNYWLEY